MLTCFRALENYLHNPLLKLPKELSDNVYEYVLDDQVLRIMVINRKLYQDTGDFPYTKTTFKIVTFKFISLLDNWKLPIMSHKDDVLDALNSIPEGIYIARFEIVGIMKGFDGIEAMDTGKFQGFKPNVDYKAELEKEIFELFPEAEIVFRAVDNIDQL
jgi:hypothetical protein